jgi:hypothetical protein
MVAVTRKLDILQIGHSFFSTACYHILGVEQKKCLELVMLE